MTLFDRVVGQERTVGLLSKHLLGNKLSHTYLFLGKEGAGKEFIARELARYILCSDIMKDECIDCSKYEKGIHPDFFVIDGTFGIKIEQIREAIEKLSMTPALSKRKVLLITKAEKIGIEGANALLKTLEEPPANSIILITASTEESLPKTITSRSQLLKLRPLQKVEIKKILQEQGVKEGVELLNSLSAGSVGLAIKMAHDKDFFNQRDKIYKDAAIVISSKVAAERFKILEDYDKEKRIRELFEVIVDLVHRGIRGELKEPSFIAPEKLFFWAKKTLKVYPNIDYNISLRIALEKIILEEIVDA